MSATPDRILRELAELWVSLGKEGQSESGAGVLRACTMTLMVFAEEHEDISAISETVAALMPEHPARTILVRLSGEGERSLTERVYSQCWMPFGQRRQICCEHIEITASDAALGDLPAVLLPLAVADLPLIAWCRSPRLLSREEFPALVQTARKLILDTAGQPASDVLPRLAAKAGGEPIIADLAWTRLTRWREMLAQVFENRENLARLTGTRNVRVTFSGNLETAARYLGAWILSAMTAVQAKCEVAIAPQADGPLRVTLEGEGLSVKLERDGERLLATVNGETNCTNLPEPGDYNLMREELGIIRRDRSFEDTLKSAASLGSLVER